MRRSTRVAIVLLALIATGSPVRAAPADTATVAVASNFAAPARELVALFERHHPYRIRLAIGSTGKLYSQIVFGAPYAAFLAADQLRPRRLAREGHAVADSVFTYATGQVVLWDPLGGDIGPQRLHGGGFRHIAIAQPALAPYGQAARQTLDALQLTERLRDRLVYGENIGQTFAFVATGNAEIGFVAAAQLAALPAAERGSRWQPPAGMHDPIHQDAVLIDAESVAARAFLAFIAGEAARPVLDRYGYSAP